VSHVLILVLGFAYLVSTHGIGHGAHLGVAPGWSSIAYALPVAMLAYTGLETVANFAAEAREPGRSLPRSLFIGIGATVAVSVAIGVVGLSAFPGHASPDGPGGYASDLGEGWLRAPLLGIVAALHGHVSGGAVHALRIVLGITGTLILGAAVSTSISGAGRLAYSLAQHGMLPHRFGKLSRRSLIPPASIASAAAISSVLLVLAAAFARE